MKKIWELIKKLKIKGKKSIKSGRGGVLIFSGGKRGNGAKNGLVSFVRG